MTRATTVVAAVVVAVALPTGASDPVVPVVWEGQPALLGADFATLNRPVVLPNGEVVFEAFLEGDSITSANDLSLWLAGAPPFELLCQEGDPYPPAGAGVTALCPLQASAVNGGLAAPARVFGTSFLSGSGVTSPTDTIRTVFAGTAGSSVLVAREGDPAPGTDAVFDQAFGDHRVLPDGRIAFTAALRGGTTASGIWSGWSSAPVLHVKAGDPAPGLDAAFQGFTGLVLSPSGYMAYRGSTATGSAGLFRGFTGSAPELVAGTGTVMPAGGTLADVASWTINRTGTVAFQGTLTTGGTGTFLRAAASPLGAVAVPGQPTPDFGSFVATSRPSIGGDHVCFFAQLSLGADGLYCQLDGTLQVIVRETDTPPALASGETVGDLVWGPVVNLHGQVLFISQVTGDGGPFLTWWLRDTAGQLRILARVGAELEIQPGGEIKTVSGLDLPGGDYPITVHGGSSTALNDRGEVTFLVDFADGTTAIVLVRPEPLPGEEVFVDGFESGTTDGWSSESGGTT